MSSPTNAKTEKLYRYHASAVEVKMVEMIEEEVRKLREQRAALSYQIAQALKERSRIREKWRTRSRRKKNDRDHAGTTKETASL